MLQSFNTGGFAMTFENGLKIAVMFSSHNQGGNKGKDIHNLMAMPHKSAYSAEVSIGDESGKLYSFPLDGKYSQGYVNADGVAEWIKAVQKATSLKDIVEPKNV